MIVIEGHFLDGKTSKRYDGRLEVLGEQSIHIVVKDHHPETIPLKFNEVKVGSRLAGTPREISFGDGQLFVTDDNDAVDQMIMHCKKSRSTSFLYKLESNLLAIIIASIVAVSVGAATMIYGIPKAAEIIAYQLPDYTSSPMDSLNILDNTVFETSTLTEARQDEIRELMRPYLEAYSELKPNLQFRSGMQANAFALPSGAIVFTDEFINMVKDDQELVAVLFHEIGHLKNKHLIRRALQDSMLTLFIILITGDLDTLDLLTGIPTLIMDLQYSKDFEREADRFALDNMHRFNVPVDNFAIVMQHLEQYYASDQEKSEQSESGKQITNFLSTHPPTEERVELVAAFKRKHGISD